MSAAPAKTPISALQEYATKQGVTPQYDLIANEGAVHEPTFIVRVTAGNSVTATGTGSSKKKAKHAAAQSALNQIRGFTTQEEDLAGAGGDNKDLQGSSDREDDARHPVGELQEFTQKKLLKPPIYEFVNEQGPPHAREYVCNIKLGKYTEKGTGRSKKSAKRDAAAKMLSLLQAMSADRSVEEDIEESEEEEDIPLEGFKKSVYSGAKRNKSKTINPKSSEAILNFYQKVMVAGGKQVRANGQSLSTPNTNYCQMLQEIAEVQRFEVQYFDIKDINTSGLNQCLVQLSTVPVAVCQGTGPVMDEAHANAAHNALQYLRIMIK